jgi:hypothetical protein
VAQVLFQSDGIDSSKLSLGATLAVPVVPKTSLWDVMLFGNRSDPFIIVSEYQHRVEIKHQHSCPRQRDFCQHFTSCRTHPENQVKKSNVLYQGLLSIKVPVGSSSQHRT